MKKLNILLYSSSMPAIIVDDYTILYFIDLNFAFWIMLMDILESFNKAFSKQMSHLRINLYRLKK